MLTATYDETYSIDYQDDLLTTDWLNGHTYGLTSTHVDPLYVVEQSDSFKSGFLDGMTKRINYNIRF